MTNQEQKLVQIKKDERTQKMLNELLPVINKAIKDNFGAYAKMVQADVTNYILLNAIKDGIIDSDLALCSKQINETITQIGKDLEKQALAKFAQVKEASEK